MCVSEWREIFVYRTALLYYVHIVLIIEQRKLFATSVRFKWYGALHTFNSARSTCFSSFSHSRRHIDALTHACVRWIENYKQRA